MRVSQKGFSVAGLYFVCPELVAILADHAGFRKVKESSSTTRNDYLYRDYVAVLDKLSERGRTAVASRAE